MCKFESWQKGESRSNLSDSSKAYRKRTSFNSSSWDVRKNFIKQSAPSRSSQMTFSLKVNKNDNKYQQNTTFGFSNTDFRMSISRVKSYRWSPTLVSSFFVLDYSKIWIEKSWKSCYGTKPWLAFSFLFDFCNTRKIYNKTNLDPNITSTRNYFCDRMKNRFWYISNSYPLWNDTSSNYKMKIKNKGILLMKKFRWMKMVCYIKIQLFMIWIKILQVQNEQHWRVC